MKAFVIAEHEAAVYRLCSGARTLADDIIFIAIGNVNTPENVANTVAHVEVPNGEAMEDATDSILAFFDKEKPEIVFAEPTRRLRIVTGRIAAHAATSVITDVISFEEDGAKSLYYAGIAERVQKHIGDTAVYTISPALFAYMEPSGSNETIELPWVAPACELRVRSTSPIEKKGSDLTKADIVVAVGRGFAEESDLEIARFLCKRIDAELACSRPIAENTGWLPPETYVGVSGLMVAPKVYVALGISGQMQHMIGCNRADTIFAVNKDENAPIFKQCDYGLVGDIKTVLPTLAEMI